MFLRKTVFYLVGVRVKPTVNAFRCQADCPDILWR